MKEVLRRGLDAVHFTEEAIKVGTTVQIDLNVEGRKDKMSQHTGQHVRLPPLFLINELSADILLLSILKASFRSHR